MRQIFFIFIVFLLLGSCGKQKITNRKDFFRWINDEENHLVVVKKVSPVVLSVKYLPPEYLSIKEMGGKFDKRLYDSLMVKYSQSRTFLLTIGLQPSEGKQPVGDIMYFNISDQEQFNRRLENLTFNFCQYIKLNTAKNTYSPVLHVFENTYGISPDRTIYLVFGRKSGVDDLLTSDRYDLIFDDQIFLTGISYFAFSRNVIDKIPEICFE